MFLIIPEIIRKIIEFFTIILTELINYWINIFLKYEIQI